MNSFSQLWIPPAPSDPLGVSVASLTDASLTQSLTFGGHPPPIFLKKFYKESLIDTFPERCPGLCPRASRGMFSNKILSLTLRFIYIKIM